MMRYRRSRVYRILILLGIAGGIFIVFQLFSLEVLSFHAKAEDRKVRSSFLNKQKNKYFNAPTARPPKIDFNPGEYEDCEDGKCVKKKLNISEGMKHVKNKYEKLVKDRVEKYDASKWVNKKPKGGVIPSTAVVLNPVKEARAVNDACAKMLVPENDNIWEFLEKCFLGSQTVHFKSSGDHVRGVLPTWSHLYQPSVDNTFTCLKSKEVITFKRVNDEYCDCSDGTDEPGTSACAGSRFYCTFQLSEKPPHWLSPTRVDDGICDCCDASDENSQYLLPRHVKIAKEGTFYGVRQAPCTDQCAKLRQREFELREMKERGARLKEEYIKAAQGQDNHNNIYGVNGEFYTLSKTCYKANFDKYAYEVCPFREVKQTWSALPYKRIGRNGEWATTGEEGWKLLMGHGEPSQCPAARPRITYIMFSCGEEDIVLNVSETEVCEYTVQFATPAAC